MHPMIERMNEINRRTVMTGSDCTQEDSVFILGFFDEFPPEETPEGSLMARVWPMEADQWYSEKEAGQR